MCIQEIITDYENEKIAATNDSYIIRFLYGAEWGNNIKIG